MVRPRFSAATRSPSLSDWRTARAAIWVYLLYLHAPRTQPVSAGYYSKTRKTYVKTLRQVALLMVVDGLGTGEVLSTLRCPRGPSRRGAPGLHVQRVTAPPRRRHTGGSSESPQARISHSTISVQRPRQRSPLCLFWLCRRLCSRFCIPASFPLLAVSHCLIPCCSGPTDYGRSCMALRLEVYHYR